MNTNRHSALGIACVALALGTGCGRPARAPSPTAASSLYCDNGYSVSVANNTQRDVDIVQFTASGQWEYVASVTATTTREVPLSNGSRVEWRSPPQPQRYDPNLSLEVTLHMHCT
jgi:hypothetical protein